MKDKQIGTEWLDETVFSETFCHNTKHVHYFMKTPFFKFTSYKTNRTISANKREGVGGCSSWALPRKQTVKSEDFDLLWNNEKHFLLDWRWAQ